jgi:hypothetical protein
MGVKLCLSYYGKDRMFESRVQRRILGPKRDEIIGGSRKLHTGDFHNSHFSKYK